MWRFKPELRVDEKGTYIRSKALHFKELLSVITGKFPVTVSRLWDIFHQLIIRIHYSTEHCYPTALTTIQPKTIQTAGGLGCINTLMHKCPALHLETAF